MSLSLLYVCLRYRTYAPYRLTNAFELCLGMRSKNDVSNQILCSIENNKHKR